MKLISLDVIEKELAQRSLYEFVKQAWHVVEPGTKFVQGKHIEIICSELQNLNKSNDLVNLVINIPPRFCKSLITCVFFPAWAWINDPSIQFLSASYSLDLAVRDSWKTRVILESDWYRNFWSDKFSISDDNNQKTNYTNNMGGHRQIVSVNSTCTGLGGDILLLDDYLNASDAHSDTKLAACKTWYIEAFQNRLNNPTKGARVCIAQRLNDQDLSAYMIDKEFRHVCMPAEYSESHPFKFDGDFRTETGQLLWEKQFPQTVLDDIKFGNSAYYATQYQQLPSPESGGIIKHSWIRYYDKLPETGEYTQSWDLSFGGNGDYTVGTVWYIAGSEYYLVDMIRGQMEFPEMLEKFKELNNKYPICKRKYVESCAAGKPLIDSLKRTISGIIPISPSKGKSERVHAVSYLFEAGNIYFPHTNWIDVVEYEITNFPNAANDDITDTITQILSNYKKQATFKSF